MMSPAVARRAQELAAEGTAFVTATVVRAQRPTSVKAGDVALVLGDGTIEGFVGGVCAQQSVLVYALKAIETEEAVLLRIVPDGPIGEDPGTGQEVAVEEGAVTAQNPCLSGGAIEIFLEPVLPAPRVLVVGDTPIAAAVVALGGELGLDVVAVAGSDTEPAAGDLAIVVAAHGRDELHTLRRALEAGVPYVGLVASHKRGAGVLADLRADGVPDAHLERIDVPAGIDIGARTPGGDRALDPRLRRLDPSRRARCRAGEHPDRRRRPRERARRRPDLRDDGRGGSRHAVDRARGQDRLLLLRRLQGQVRGTTPGCLTEMNPQEDTGEAAGELRRLAPDIETLARRLAEVDYLVDEGLATSMFLSLRLPQPLLLEGEAGVGKTEAAKALALVLDTPLIRLQCYEGIDAAEALYEWNYPRQLLAIRLAESSGTGLAEEELFGPDYLIRRPLLRALEHPGPRPAVLLIDEIDRADDDFEAFLLELLADASVTIPEIGTVRATHPPVIVLTSNRTRDLHDAVKRRCLYHRISYPTPQREVEIVRRRVKGASETLAVQVANAVSRMRGSDVQKPPGIAEAIDWLAALSLLGIDELDAAAADRTLGSVLKYDEDQEVIRAAGLEQFVRTGD